MGAGAAATSRGNDAFTHLMDPNRRWYNNRRLIALHAWVVLLLITSSTNGFDGSIINSFQSLPVWQAYFGKPEGGRLGLLNAIQNIGSLAAYPFSPYLSDGLGRRPTIWVGAVIMLVAVVLQSAAQNFGMFVGARFLIGFGLTFAANAAPMLVTEISYPAYRAPLTSLYNSLWYSGNIVATWSTFGTQNIGNDWAWRIPSILQGIPPVFQFVLMWFCPESPRWLVSKGREEQALKTLAYYHADGNEQDPLVQFEFNEIKSAIAFDRDVSANIGWRSLFSTPGNRKRMALIIAIAFFSQWSGNGLVSYYLKDVLESIGILDSTTQLLIGGILSIYNLFWAVLASFFVERAGRRLLFLTSASGMLVSFILQTICTSQYVAHGQKGAANAVLAFIFIFYAFYDIAFTPLIVSYTVEILPFSLRAKGFTIFNFTISLALIFNQYVNPIAFGVLRWKYYIVYCCWLAFELAFCYFMIVETKNLSLEETAALFDGEDATRNLHAATQNVRTEDFDEKGSSSGYTPNNELKA